MRIADLLPNELAPRTAEPMEQGTSVIKKTLETAAVRGLKGSRRLVAMRCVGR